jgi:hypothetical protein
MIKRRGKPHPLRIEEKGGPGENNRRLNVKLDEGIWKKVRSEIKG